MKNTDVRKITILVHPAMGLEIESELGGVELVGVLELVKSKVIADSYEKVPDTTPASANNLAQINPRSKIAGHDDRP